MQKQRSEYTVDQYAALMNLDDKSAKRALEKLVRERKMHKTKTYKWCPKGGWNNTGGYRQINQYYDAWPTDVFYDKTGKRILDSVSG
jgi:hypothetical protein